MYAHYFFITLSLFFTAYSYCADAAATPCAWEWHDLAFDKKMGAAINVLPADVQAIIVSYMHAITFSSNKSKSLLDDWQTNDAICVQKLKTPNIIHSSHVAGDRVAYLTPTSDCMRFELHWIDLITKEDHLLSYEYEDHISCMWNCRWNPEKIAICGNSIVLKSINKRLYGLIMRDAEKKHETGTIFQYLRSMTPAGWVTHSLFPLCAMLFEVNSGITYLRICELNELAAEKWALVGDTEFFLHGTAKEWCLQWHPEKAVLIVAAQKGALVILNKAGGILHEIKEDAELTRDLHFSAHSNTFFVKHKKGLYRYNFNIGESPAGVTREIIPRDDTANFDIKAVGYKRFLTESKAGDNQHQLILRSLEEVAFKLPMVVFDHVTYPKQLPTIYDNRYIIVQQNQDIDKSTISIFLPKYNAHFQHYCIFQAALAAEKSKQTNDWQLFKKEETKQLVRETAQHYAYFKKLMDDNGIKLGA